MEETPRILVIDDDDLILKTMGNVLGRQGYFYRLAGDAEAALKYVAEIEFDMILADIRMPVMNGVDAVKKIQEDRKKQNKREIPIIFITGYAENGMHFKAGKLGEVIQKPFNLDHLMITMREYL
jgi:CheY-like chemotaxis protein